MLWARNGEDEALSAYEDRVLRLLADHGARVVSRVRRIDDGDGPLEVQIIELPDQAALDAYMEDPRRLALAETRDRAVARTEMLRVESIRDSPLPP